MKFVSIIRYYLKGIRLSASVLSLMLLWAMLSGVILYGSVQHVYSDITSLQSDQTENTSILMYFSNLEQIQTGSFEKYTKSVEAALEADERVEQVFCVRVVNPVSYNEVSTSIILYEPEMLDAFPQLKKNGIDFSDSPNGCILGSKQFNKLKTGDMIELEIRNQKVQFPVAGRLDSPYRRLSLSVSSTIPRAEYLFSEGDVIIMQDTQQVMEQLAELDASVAYNQNLIVRFKEGLIPQEKDAVLSELANKYLAYSFEEMFENSNLFAENTLKQKVPQPLFLAITAMAAYFSIMILSLKKKEKDMAVLCLCGMSRKKYGTVVFAVCQLFVFLPILICIGFLLIWPEVQWNFSVLFFSTYTASAKLGSLLLRLGYYLDSITVNISCLPVVIVYYAVTVLISLGITIGSMARHTPLTYLRGAE